MITFNNLLKNETMTVNRTSKIKINGLIISQLGVILAFVVHGVMFYGGQLEINNHTKETMVTQSQNIKDMTDQVNTMAIQTGTYATKSFVTRSVKVEKDDRVKEDDYIKATVRDNQVVLIDLIKSNIK